MILFLYGYPISNTSCYVVSKQGGLSPINSAGELWVGGDGVSTGYLNRPDLNKDKFIPNIYGTGSLYKTGDLVKLLPDGSIDFIGRIDNQVKIRGFRIELSEIDSKILTYPNIKESITIVSNINDNKYICSYISSDENINVNILKDYLKGCLPNYMIPSYITILDKLPLNINGKIEKKKLPPININSCKKEILEPKTDLQKEILLYVKEITKLDNISIDDDFSVDLNLDSLSTMALTSKLYKYNINIQDITNYPTIEKLSEKISNNSSIDCYNNNFIDVKIINKSFNYDLSNILLTGTTGFLGTHILRELLVNKNVEKIYCLIREKNNKSPKERLKDIQNNFFEKDLYNLIENKVIILNGDFIYDNLNLSNEIYNDVCKKITTVIHCGAKVKHFGKYKDFYNANVLATKNIIKFCKDSNSSLAYVSTLSVGGLCKTNDIKFIDENSININQEFKNQVYMYTKYQAECEVLKEIENNNLNAKIFRLGNIMPRLSDGVFQTNYNDNAFICKIHTLLKTHSITNSLEKYKFDLSPVDLCAKSIVLLLENKNSQTIYHIYNNYYITLKDFFNLANISLSVISDDELINNIIDLDNVYDTHLLNELKYSGYMETPSKNDTTIKILNNLNFNWNKISAEYVEKIIKQGDFNYEAF